MTGQVGRARGAVVPTIAVLLAAVLLSAIALAALRSDVASAPTVVVEGTFVTAALPDGTRRPLPLGAEVPRGATVTAGPDGAVLRTRDRDVHLGRRAELAVLDGQRQVLGAGFVMVDARRGPGVEVETAAATVTTPEGAVSRVERSAVVRVGAFAGNAVRVQATGRRASTELRRWTQTQVPAGGLPGRVTPLQLTGDRYERRLAPDLVADDRTLSALGRSLGNGGEQGRAVLAALEAALPGSGGPVTGVPAAGLGALPVAAAPPSERALAFLVATAAATGGASGGAPGQRLDVASDELPERYSEVRALRADGGSWGPVARLVGAAVPGVSRLLDGLLTPFVLVAGELPGPVDLAALLAPPGGSAAGAAVVSRLIGGAGASGSGLPATPAAGDGPPPPADAPPPPADAPPPPDDAPPPPVAPPAPVPPPPSDPGGTVTDAVDAVVETVIGLVPERPEPRPLPPLPPLPDLPLVSEPAVERPVLDAPPDAPLDAPVPEAPVLDAPVDAPLLP